MAWMGGFEASMVPGVGIESDGNPASPNSRNRIDGPDRRLDGTIRVAAVAAYKFEKGRESGAESYPETSPLQERERPAAGPGSSSRSK